MLGDGDGVAAGRIHHNDAACCSCGNIDAVHADAGAANDFEVGGRVENVFGDSDGAAHENGMGGGEMIAELVLIRNDDVEARLGLEDRDRGGRNGVGD